MFIGNQYRNKKKFNILKGILALVLVLGSVLGVTFAYIYGTKSVDDDPSDTPFISGEVYYNNTKLTGDYDSVSITGNINASGVVTLNVAGSTLAANPGENIDLPLSIKNAGNVDAVLVDLMVTIEIVSSDSEFIWNATNNEDEYYLTLNTNTTNGYTITDNTFIDNSSVTYLKNSANSSQFITSLSVDSTIASSELCNCTFTITIQLGLGQVGISDL